MEINGGKKRKWGGKTRENIEIGEKEEENSVLKYLTEIIFIMLHQKSVLVHLIIHEIKNIIFNLMNAKMNKIQEIWRV